MVIQRDSNTHRRVMDAILDSLAPQQQGPVCAKVKELWVEQIHEMEDTLRTGNIDNLIKLATDGKTLHNFMKSCQVKRGAEYRPIIGRTAPAAGAPTPRPRGRPRRQQPTAEAET